MTMSYNPTNWVNGQTPINDSNLNHIEQGIKAVFDLSDAQEIKIAEIANNQIPEEYLQQSVDNYIANNQAGLATKTDINNLSSEIVYDVNNGYLAGGVIKEQTGSKEKYTSKIPCIYGDIVSFSLSYPTTRSMWATYELYNGDTFVTRVYLVNNEQSNSFNGKIKITNKSITHIAFSYRSYDDANVSIIYNASSNSTLAELMSDKSGLVNNQILEKTNYMASIVPALSYKFDFSFDLSANEITITVPQRTFLFAKPQNPIESFVTIDMPSATSYTLPNKSVLCYDIANNCYVVLSQAEFSSNIPNYVLCAHNHYGTLKGQWYIYYLEQITYENKVIVSSDDSIGVEITSRQGEVINGTTSNTLEGIRLAKKYGYNHIRLSVCWTSDGVAVLSHGATVIVGETQYTIANTPYDALSNVLPTLEEGATLCKMLRMKLDIELKFGVNNNNLLSAWNIVSKLGMTPYTLWSGDIQSLSYILSIQPTASVGFVAHISKNVIDTALTLKNDSNYVRIDAFNNDGVDEWNDDWSDEVLQYASSKNIPIKVGSAYNVEQLKRWAKVVQIVEVAGVQYPYDVLYKTYIE